MDNNIKINFNYGSKKFEKLFKPFVFNRLTLYESKLSKMDNNLERSFSTDYKEHFLEDDNK